MHVSSIARFAIHFFRRGTMVHTIPGTVSRTGRLAASEMVTMTRPAAQLSRQRTSVREIFSLTATTECGENLDIACARTEMADQFARCCYACMLFPCRARLFRDIPRFARCNCRTFDHDDGSQFFNDTANLMVFGGCKNYLGAYASAFSTAGCCLSYRTRVLLQLAV